jgi:FAD/FMN-containing dehydrogenase
MATLAPEVASAAVATTVENVTGLYSVHAGRVVLPASVQDVAEQVRGWRGKVAIGGGRYSMGGQIAITGGLHLDMRGMNQLVMFDAVAKVARVQAGMRWRDLQDLIDPSGLAVQTMQSYANFTVGGAVSVNAHGRYVGNGPVGNSVRALQLVLADGSVVETSRRENSDLFRAAIGGYGAIGVITEVEFDLAVHTRIGRCVEAVAIGDYPRYFRTVEAWRDCVFHNADLMPPRFDELVAVSWRRTKKPLTETTRLVPRGKSYAMNQNVIFVITELPGGDALRSKVVHPLLMTGPMVTWRNHQASLDVAELEPRTRALSTYVLQEYFIPVRRFSDFVRAMARTIRRHRADVLNVSVRHSPPDQLALVPWAKEEVFSFVVYYKQRTHRAAQRDVAAWTRQMIDEALRLGGRYYLPYQLHATRDQFDAAYPEASQLRALKQRVDPGTKFSNELWAKYL